MSTLRKMVSDIRGSHRILSTDALITDRVIASEIKNNSHFLIKRETNFRKLWATDTIFTTIPCLELIEVPITECCDYTDNLTISRTKLKLPLIAEGNYQYLIQGVYSINALGGKGKKFKEVTINRFINLQKLPGINKQSYYWISNSYLYTNNPDLQSLRIVALFNDDVPNSLMYPECNCGNIEISLEDYCKNPLDKPFYCPGYLEKQVLDLTSQKLLSTYFRLKTDISQDNIDGQSLNTPNFK
jgi:hypothetical protein